jgi:flavin-dependent dehydrogenase
MKKNFDIIIVGAGTGGCVLAKKVAEAGFDVALVDKKSKNKTGNEWEVTVEKSILNRIHLKFPDRALLEESPVSTRFFALDRSKYVQMDTNYDNVFIIQHWKFNRLLLDAALNAGVTFLGSHEVKELVLDKNTAAGIKGVRKGRFGTKKFKISARIVVDASGVAGLLRRQVPQEFLLKRGIHKYDFASAWQELREISTNQADKLMKSIGIAPGICYTRVGKYHAYQAIHLRKDNTVNLIFGASIGHHAKTPVNFCRISWLHIPFSVKKYTVAALLSLSGDPLIQWWPTVFYALEMRHAR